MRVGEFLINEKTRVSISIATLLFVIGSTATVVFTISGMKSEIDLSINSIEKDQIRIEEKFDSKITDLELSDSMMISEQQTNRQLLSENQTDLAEIKTDLKWIRAYMERDK